MPAEGSAPAPGAGGRGPGISLFRDLRVWQQSVCPSSELYGLTNPHRRAAASVPSNIAEGHTRASRREYLNHVSVAQASLAEIETQLEISLRLGHISTEPLATVLTEVVGIGKQWYALRDALARKL